MGNMSQEGKMEYSDVVNNWKFFAEAIKKADGEVKALSVEEPATESEVAMLEGKLGFELPHSFKEVLLGFSKNVDFRWFMPDNYEFEDDLCQIFSGDMHWSLDGLVKFNEDKNGWRDDVFPNKEDSYDIIWHDKLAFHEVGNGDYLAVDLSRAGKEPIVYLSHDGGEGHGVEMANNFKEFVFLSSRIGCVGAEDWQWLPFIVEGRPYIDPSSDNANKFRDSLRVNV
jgi:hypothetical protein